jgi:hypothetical protein
MLLRLFRPASFEFGTIRDIAILVNVPALDGGI